jgi:hypothetical protein
MSPATIAQIEFVKDCLRKGFKRDYILAKFRNKWQSVATRTIDSRIKAASVALEAEIRTINQKTEVRLEKQSQALMLKTLPIAERIDLLAKIATGEIKIKKPFVISGKIMEYPAEPDHNDRTKAIAELNKMDGSYAAQKLEVQDTTINIARTVVTKKV